MGLPRHTGLIQFFKPFLLFRLQSLPAYASVLLLYLFRHIRNYSFNSSELVFFSFMFSGFEFPSRNMNKPILTPGTDNRPNKMTHEIWLVIPWVYWRCWQEHRWKVDYGNMGDWRELQRQKTHPNMGDSSNCIPRSPHDFSQPVSSQQLPKAL